MEYRPLTIFKKLERFTQPKKDIEKRVRNNLNKKHQSTKLDYFKLVSQAIVYNEKCHIVAVFKDFLIFEEKEEFLSL